MGSSGSESVDCGIGSIVWVRRRNGSWWPGKILGPDELSTTHLMSPRSGTPVKLLGRQDASVDWYNLEKSKRVKAFRCGEFDDCIERAESSLGMPPKKREKYARREDAILHALELEKQMLGNHGDKLSITPDVKSNSPLTSLKTRSVTSENLRYDGKHGNVRLQQLPGGVGLFPKDENGNNNNHHVQKPKEGNELDSEDNNSDSPTRTRGLQEFGLRTAPIKGNNGLDKLIADDCAQMGCSNGGINSAISLDKGDVSSDLLIDNTSVRRRDRRRPLVQVLQSSMKSPIQHVGHAEKLSGSLSGSGADQVGNIFMTKRSQCLYQPAESNDRMDDSASSPHIEMFPSQSGESYSGTLSEESTSESSEDTESNSSDSEDLETDSDEEMSMLSGRRVGSVALGVSEAQRIHRNMSNEETDESTHIDDTPVFHACYPNSTNVAMSKWLTKGKRNTRQLSKTMVDIADARVSDGSTDETYLRIKGGNLNKRASGQTLNFHHRSYDYDGGLDETDLTEKDYRTLGFDNRGYSFTSKHALRGWNSGMGRDIIDWEDLAWEDQASLGGHLDHTSDYFDPVSFGCGRLGGRPRTMLVDVDLKVRTSYPKQRVPIVSLMSKLDGKAIIGHPIQIEALEDGSSETMLSRMTDIGNETYYNEGDATLPPVWRTARRTANYRVPRPDLSLILDDDESEDYQPLETKPPFKRLNTGVSNHNASLTTKSLFHIPRPPMDRNSLRKTSKKVSLSSSQKTRTLSSFVTDHKLGVKSKRDSDSYSLHGLIKSEAGATTVACIPVKLVFSRLYEAVGRPPASMASSSHEVLVNMNTETNQSD